MNKKKNLDIIFLIQRNNKLGYKDIDHILPFLHFLSKISKLKYKAKGLIFDNEENYIKDLDPRVEFLSKMWKSRIYLKKIILINLKIFHYLK